MKEKIAAIAKSLALFHPTAEVALSLLTAAKYNTPAERILDGIRQSASMSLTDVPVGALISALMIGSEDGDKKEEEMLVNLCVSVYSGLGTIAGGIDPSTFDITQAAMDSLVNIKIVSGVIAGAVVQYGDYGKVPAQIPAADLAEFIDNADTDRIAALDNLDALVAEISELHNANIAAAAAAAEVNNAAEAEVKAEDAIAAAEADAAIAAIEEADAKAATAENTMDTIVEATEAEAAEEAVAKGATEVETTIDTIVDAAIVDAAAKVEAEAATTNAATEVVASSAVSEIDLVVTIERDSVSVVDAGSPDSKPHLVVAIDESNQTPAPSRGGARLSLCSSEEELTALAKRAVDVDRIINSSKFLQT